MNIRRHKKARTTPEIRRETQASDLPATVLARKYGVHRHPLRKWRKRDSVEDASHRPHRVHATLSPPQEAVTHEFINPQVSRSSLVRCLRRYGVSDLKALVAPREGPDAPDKPRPKTFKDYAPGLVHVDLKSLPQMPDEAQRKYLYAGVDRASRWAYVEILENKEADTAAGFLERLIHKAPFNARVLTDNGKSQQIPQKALGHMPPIQALKQWQARRPDLFKKRVYNLAVFDSHRVMSEGSTPRGGPPGPPWPGTEDRSFWENNHMVWGG